MKSQKRFPFLLLAIAVLLLGAVAMMNMNATKNTLAADGHDHGQTAPAEPTGEQPKADAQQIAQEMRSRVAAGAKSDGAKVETAPIPDRPTIAVEPPAPYKPVPNDSMTAPLR